MLLDWLRFTHGLRLLDGDLGSDWLGVHLRQGEWGENFEVLWVEELLLLQRLGSLLLQDWLDLDHGLDQLVVGSGLNNGLLLLLGFNLLDDLGSFVAAQEKLTASIVNGFLGLGRLDESLEVVSLLEILFGISIGFERLALLSKLLNDLFALLAGSDASIWVLQEGNELFALLEMDMVSLESHIECDTCGKGDHESNESCRAPQILVELLLGEISVRQAREEG